ncbi:MAG: hypothetical protein OXC30_03220 [Alphaproteobacteria bacterium]|nr:hypothetical protein [Alphaproteobacteria bacterium]
MIQNIIISVMIFLQAQGAANSCPLPEDIESASAQFSDLKLDMKTSTDIGRSLASILQVSWEIDSLMECENTCLDILAEKFPEVDKALPMQFAESFSERKNSENPVSENPVAVQLNDLVTSGAREYFDIMDMFDGLWNFMQTHWDFDPSWSDDHQGSFRDSLPSVRDVLDHLAQHRKIYQELEDKQKQSFASLQTLMTERFGVTVPPVFRNTMERLSMYCAGADNRKYTACTILNLLKKLCTDVVQEKES